MLCIVYVRYSCLLSFNVKGFTSNSPNSAEPPPPAPSPAFLQFLPTLEHAPKMATESFRWRTVLEVAVISIVIYIFLGTPGLRNSLEGKSASDKDVPIARAKIESLVYPNEELKCAKHDFGIHVFSTNPLVIYIERFLSEMEAQHLVDIR